VSARNERAARRAARLKRPLMIAPSPYTEDASVVYRAYADALREAGEDPAEYDVMGSYTVQVLDPGEQVVEPKGADSRLQQYIDWYAQDGDLPDEAGRIANPSDRLRRQIGVTGDAAACIAGIEELLEQVPFTLLMVGGISIKQMTRFSEQVAPHFRD
jgi:alkanesulfonate monooxygenase SsuD/methylene tetrahydromethanopterin reductase-like flavin-dependent oxidoreductase (luciferase family)